MKKIIIVLLILTFTLSVNAQVADSTIHKQLNLEGYRAQRMAGTAATMTIIGALGVTAGIIIDRHHSEVSPITGTVVAELGACLFCVGVPLWVIEVSKMNAIKIEMIRYGGTSKGTGVGMKFKF
jgi:hypothetical protein